MSEGAVEPRHVGIHIRFLAVVLAQVLEKLSFLSGKWKCYRGLEGGRQLYDNPMVLPNSKRIGSQEVMRGQSKASNTSLKRAISLALGVRNSVLIPMGLTV